MATKTEKDDKPKGEQAKAEDPDAQARRDREKAEKADDPKGGRDSALNALAELRKLAVEGTALTPAQVIDTLTKHDIDSSDFDKRAAGV